MSTTTSKISGPKPENQRQSYSWDYGKERLLTVKTDLNKMLDRVWASENVFPLNVKIEPDNTLKIILARADSRLLK